MPYIFPIVLCGSLITLTGFSTNKPVENAHPPIHTKNNTGATSTYQNGYQPYQLKKSYGLNQISATGIGQTIAIVDAYGSPSIQNDLSVFDQQFALPTANLQVVYPQGKPKKVNSSWALETSLDVEWAHALAPDAKIMLVIAKSASVTDLINAVDYATASGARVISNSWGTPEFSSEVNYDSHFQHNGIVYVASSGDNGSGVEWPAASPYVLSVGGTTLNLESSGNYLGETAWSGSGGGISAYESLPSYQENWKNIVGSNRGVPDVSWDADPNTGVAVYDSTPNNNQSGWYEIGGTSVGAPCFSAVLALADQGRNSPLNSVDVISKLYNDAATTGSIDYVTYFHDITQGTNGGYSALSGYDLATGIGSGVENNLIPTLSLAP